jgi:hypothetical protein
MATQDTPDRNDRLKGLAGLSDADPPALLSARLLEAHAISGA